MFEVWHNFFLNLMPRAPNLVRPDNKDIFSYNNRIKFTSLTFENIQFLKKWTTYMVKGSQNQKVRMSMDNSYRCCREHWHYALSAPQGLAVQILKWGQTKSRWLFVTIVSLNIVLGCHSILTLNIFQRKNKTKCRVAVFTNANRVNQIRQKINVTF